MTQILSKDNTNGQISSRFFRNVRERMIEFALFLAALSSVGTTFGILYILVTESWLFFQEVSLFDFLTDTQWTPLFNDKHYGILPLLSGTFVTSSVALLVAIPLGTIVAIYLSEFSSSKLREWVKPILELLAAIPTVVYGYFALLVVTPLLQKVFTELPTFNMLSGGLVMGLMILPLISSICEDAMRAVVLVQPIF